MGRNLDSDIAVYCTQPEGPAVARRMLLRGWSSRREGRRGRKAAKEKAPPERGFQCLGAQERTRTSTVLPAST